MVGIQAYGGYIPKLRLERMSIFQTMGWLAPGIMMVAGGERSMCNWDEDSLSMAFAAARDCLGGVHRKHVDGLYLASTTLPFADRDNAGIVAAALNLNEQNLRTADFSSTRKSGTTALLAALDSVASGERSSVVVAASDKIEVRSAWFHEMWYGDAAASLLVGKDNVIAKYLGSYSVSCDFVSHYRGSGREYDYNWEERWIRDEGYAKIIPEAVHGVLKKCQVAIGDVSKIVFPCFFTREQKDIAKKMGCGKGQVPSNLHDEMGEAGAAHPFVLFVKALQEAKPGDKIVVASFGQGSDALLFEVTDAIQDLQARKGVNGSLEDRRPISNYPKFLKFRDLINTEMGIRAEVPMQTALSTLWRQRKMILGLVGGKCRKCGTPAFPKSDICVNPDCHAVREFDDYEFSEKEAVVKSFTGDLLAVSVDPPAIYGLIEFDGGGRMMCDFTDCALEDVKVGQKMSMTFRWRYYDKERGFTGYFWKAMPKRA